MACAHRAYRVALFELARLGVVRLFVTPEVVAEVDDRLAYACERSGADLAVARGYWNEAKTCLRIVEIAPGDLPHLATSAIADRQIAALGRVFGSALTWSADGHLTDPECSRPYPLEVVLAVQELSAGESAAYLSVNFSAAGLEAATAGVRAVAAAAERRPLIGLAIVAVAAFAAGYTFARRRDVLAALRQPAVGEALVYGVKGVVGALEWRRAVLDRIPGVPSIVPADPTWVSLARILAAAPVPVSAARLRGHLALHDVPITVERVREELAARSMFVRTPAGRWQLGAW